MEILALIVLFGMGQEINKNIDKIDELTYQVQLQDKWIRDLENYVTEIDDTTKILTDDFINLAAKHSAHAAASNTVDDRHDRKIENIIGYAESLEDKLEYVDKKIQVLHP